MILHSRAHENAKFLKQIVATEPRSSSLAGCRHLPPFANSMRPICIYVVCYRIYSHRIGTSCSFIVNVHLLMHIFDAKNEC